MRKQTKISTSNQRGFAHLGLILLGVAVIGVVGIAAWRIQDAKERDNANVSKKDQSSQADKLASKEKESTNLQTEKSAETTTPQNTGTNSNPSSSSSSQPDKKTTSSSPTPSTTTTPTPTPTSPTPAPWQVVHPDASNCPGGSTKTVYSSVEAGAPIYNYDLDSSNNVVGSLAYKASKTGICYITAGKVWIQFDGTSYPNARYLRAQDVSITAP